MSLLPRKFSVSPNTKGYLYYRNKLVEELGPGIFYKFDPIGFFGLYVVPLQEFITTVDNQEVLAKDLVAFRFSYSISFCISDPALFVSRVQPDTAYAYSAQVQANTRIHLESQVVLRERISQCESQEVNQRRAELFVESDQQIQAAVAPYGIKVCKLWIRDLTFPKRVQELFALELESRIRAKADLENARTTVAAARALKNAGEIFKDDPAVQYLKYLDTIGKIAASGKHTFVIGEQRAIPGK